jgi:hypothetical protein
MLPMKLLRVLFNIEDPVAPQSGIFDKRQGIFSVRNWCRFDSLAIRFNRLGRILGYYFSFIPVKPLHPVETGDKLPTSPYQALDI